MPSKDDITYFAEVDFRNTRTRFGIKRGDRPRHMYIVGKTGMGKSTLLENLVVQDIQNGEGVAVIDPHGTMAERLLDYVPPHRVKDVIYFAPFDADYPISFNVMEDVGHDKRHLVASGLMSTFKKIWADAWSAKMEYILNNILLALLEYPESTLLGINRMLSDKDYRKKVADNISDPSVKAFWTDEFAKHKDRYMQEAGAAIQNKVGQFVSNPIIRNIVGQTHSSFDIRKLMDEKKILIMNLSKGRMGEQNSNLIGSMLITKIYLAAMSRADKLPAGLNNLPDFYFYVDEFQSFANESFLGILSEARKYKLNLTIAHQYIEQTSEKVRAAVFGNVGTTICFRVGPLDAKLMEKIFTPVFFLEDLTNLDFSQIYITLMIDGVGSKPFSAQTLPPIKPPDISFKKKIIDNTRASFSTARREVEALIGKWSESTEISSQRTETGNGGENGEKYASFAPRVTVRRDFREDNSRGNFRKEETRNIPQAKPVYSPPAPPLRAPEPLPSRPQPVVQMYPKAPVEQIPVIKQQMPRPEPANPIPLNYLGRNKTGSATPNKMVLKEALERAMGEQTREDETLKKEDTPKADVVLGPAPVEHKPKEIPEEILRKVLE